jgi:signal transduction histidine kinase
MRAFPSLLDLVGRRLTLRPSSRETVEVERILAVARLLLAFGSLLALAFGSTEPARYASITLLLLLAYFGHSLALLAIVSRRAGISNRVTPLVHVADLLWPAAISVFTGGANSPFFFYFSFAMLAAAFRWGMRATLATTIASLAIIVVEALLLTGPLKEAINSGFNLNGFLLRETYLTIFGILVGYLAEAEKRRRAEALNAAHIANKARVDVGMKGTMQAVLQEVLALSGARGLLLAAAEAESQQGYLWRAEVSGEGNGSGSIFSGRQLEGPEQGGYFFAMPSGCVGAAWRGSHSESAVAIDESGSRIPEGKCLLGAEFAAQHSPKLLLLGKVSVAPDIEVRLFLFEPRLGGLLETQLRILRGLMNSVAPSVYNVYLLRRLHSRAAAAERGRMARELHDGVVQSLHAIAFRLYALRTSQGTDVGKQNQELTEIQELVQNETVNLRALIRQLEPLHFDPRHLLDYLSRMVEQFRYDTGIGAKFVCDLADIGLPANTCRELAGIVREALANVLKHSGAGSVVVRLSAQTLTC